MEHRAIGITRAQIEPNLYSHTIDELFDGLDQLFEVPTGTFGWFTDIQQAIKVELVD